MTIAFFIALPFAVLGLAAVSGLATALGYRRYTARAVVRAYKKWRKANEKYRREYESDI